MDKEENILKDFKQKFDELVTNHKGRIVITSHINPDDDSISSSLSVYTYLKDILKITNSVEIYYSNNPVDRWNTVKYFKQVKFVKDIDEILTNRDLLILLDCQGYYWASLQPWEASTLGSYPFWVTRVFAGLAMFAGFLCFLYNLYRTHTGAEPAAGRVARPATA